uniref:BOD1/SHG1 domain-containing protein n=1 Tax=Anopheles christyi TaxID=43041 RepID=A0A182JPM4_9DIPT
MIDDPHFIDAMVQELKSQGLFDQFRKECLADVDTKPAYQNLRQRVEGTVNKFLGQQEWSDNIRYKNQLREQLRKNIIESGFLDTGVERIVDQVVNPKIATIFQPKVEEIVYNYLGIEKPKSSVNGNEQAATRPESLLEDLEAVSPDSDKKSEGSLTPSPPPPQPPSPPEEPVEHGVENMDIDEDEALDESKEPDDFESPAFEPLEVRSPSKPKEDTNDSNSSVISGLTSQESVESDDKADNPVPEKSIKQSTNVPPSEEQETPTTKDSEFSQEIAPTNDSQLSQVSSNSQLLTATVASSSEEAQPPEENERLDITEEAQMATLFSSSTDKVSSSNEGEQEGQEAGKQITFDFKKDEYDFVGTGRPSAITSGEESFGEGIRGVEQEEDSNTPTATPTETPTETPTKPKEAEEPNLSLHDEETSQSEHSLKICEDTFSDDNTKDSQSKDTPASVQDSPSKIKGLSDASSCSMKSDQSGKNVPSSPAHKNDEKVAPEQEQMNEEQRPEEETKEETQKEKDKEDTEQKDKSPKPSKVEDDHYQEHHKHEPNRRSSDRDSEDGNDKQDSGGSAAPSAADGKGEKLNTSSQESTEKAPEKEKSPINEPTDDVESPRLSKERDRLYGSVTPTGAPIDSSSSGIQSGDDSEKSPETLKSYSKPESIVLPVQPVVIDQMLTSMEDDKIERLLNGETHTNDATIESLKRKWQLMEGKIRKPKFASNFSEARRLMKVRKQIQRHEQKCRDQALAMAKKYINESKAFSGRGVEDQGIELEFVCDGKRKSPGPMISSPVPKVEPTGENAQSVGATDPELLYFPEEEEVFQLDEQRLNFLRSKTDGVTFGKNFKVQHYRTMIYSLTVAPAPATPRVSKRSTTGSAGSAKAKRTAAVNGVTKKLDLVVEAGSNRAGLATIRKQRSIRNRLVEKSTPPSVGTDA